MWVIATILVRGVNSFSNSSIRKLPSSSTGAHLITAPWRSRRKCQGTMLEWCSMIESTISSPAFDAFAPEGIGDEVDRLGGVAGEDDLLGAAGVEEAAHLLARVLVGLGRGIGEIVQAAMDVGVFVACRRAGCDRAPPSASAPRPRCRDRPAACRRPAWRGSGNPRGCGRRRSCRLRPRDAWITSAPSASRRHARSACRAGPHARCRRPPRRRRPGSSAPRLPWPECRAPCR